MTTAQQIAAAVDNLATAIRNAEHHAMKATEAYALRDLGGFKDQVKVYGWYREDITSANRRLVDLGIPVSCDEDLTTDFSFDLMLNELEEVTA